MTARIVSAAIRFGAKVFSEPMPARHCEIIRAQGVNGVEGFLDDAGIFHSRSDAALMALASGQIAKLREPALLYTCDLRVGKKVR